MFLLGNWTQIHECSLVLPSLASLYCEKGPKQTGDSPPKRLPGPASWQCGGRPLFFRISELEGLEGLGGACLLLSSRTPPHPRLFGVQDKRKVPIVGFLRHGRRMNRSLFVFGASLPLFALPLAIINRGQLQQAPTVDTWILAAVCGL